MDELLSDLEDICCLLLEKNVYNKNDVWWLKKWLGIDVMILFFENNYVIFCLFEVYLNVVEVGVKIGGVFVVKGLNYLNVIV